jgi:hypothetical protein
MIMLFGKKTVLALALVAATSPLFAQACDHHEHHSHNHQLCTDESEEDFVNGLSGPEIHGRRTQARFRVGDHDWGTLGDFEDAGARCTTAKPEQRTVALAADTLAKWRERMGPNRLLATVSIEIPVYFHAIKKSDGSGGPSNNQIAQQIQVLNDSFFPFFNFVLKRTDASKNRNNSNWYSATIGSDSESQMKSALRQGGVNALNVYASAPGGGVLGWATFPFQAANNLDSDGVVVRSDSLPGGTLVPFNEGDTLVHEVGVSVMMDLCNQA